jgi:hypothetical protein
MGRDDPHDRGIQAVLSNSPPPDPWSIYQKLVATPLSETINLADGLRLP